MFIVCDCMYASEISDIHADDGSVETAVRHCVVMYNYCVLGSVFC